MTKEKTIREVFGEDVDEIVQLKTKDMDVMLTVRTPVKGIKIIKNEYKVTKEKKNG